MNTISQDIKIINKLGLHARAAAKLVSVASKYSCGIEIEKSGQRVNGKSIMGVMMLAAGKGSIITLHLDGKDADQCLKDISRLVKNRFDEAE